MSSMDSKRHLSKTADAKKVTSFPKYIQDSVSKAKGTLGSLDDTGLMCPPRQDLNVDIAKSKSLTGGNLFDVDHQSLGDFALPGKPEAKTIIPTSVKHRMSKAKAVKSVVDPESEALVVSMEHEYNFLPQAMILDTPLKYLAPSTNKPVNHSRDNNQTSSDLDKIASIMEGIKTGDDAINFFARFGAESPVKFVHLYAVNDPKVYRPYDLVVIDEGSSPSGEHYTMSSAGIVRICPGEQSECFPLANWMRQSMMFNILRNIPFYKYYLHCKAFTTWRDNVRFLLFTKQRKKVVEKLFLARKSTCQPILEVKKQLLDVQRVHLLHLELKTSDKDVFMDQQNAQCMRANALFEDSTRKIIAEVQNVIMEVTNMHTNMHSEAAIAEAGGQEKTKSLVKIIQEKAERKALRAKTRMEYNSLPDFIRLVDYLTVETLVMLTIHTVQLFYEELMKQRKVGIFETFVRFGTSGTFFSPTCIDFKEMMDRLLDLMVTTVGNVNRVSYLSHKLSPLGPNVQAIIRENRLFLELADALQTKISNDFERATEHVLSFDSVRPIYDFNLSWNFDEYRAQDYDIASQKAMLEKINNWQKELEKLRNKPIGVLEVDSKRLKGELVPLRDARLAEIKEYIKDIARERCAHLLEHYKDCLVKLAPKPSYLKDFASQVQVVNAMKEEEKTLFKATSQVDQLYNFLAQYEVQIPSEDLVSHEDLHEMQQQYKAEIEASGEYKDSKLFEMGVQLDHSISKLIEQIGTVSVRLVDPMFSEATFFDEADKVLDDLGGVAAKLDNLDILAKTYSGYQKLFDANVTEYKDLDASREKMEQMRQLWDLVRNWCKKHKSWLESDFSGISVEDVDKEVQVFFKDSYTIHKKLNNRVSDMLKNRISDFKTMMPNILDLGNPNMLPRHWDTIYRAMGSIYNPEDEIRLTDLLAKGVMKHKELIQSTSACASGEAALEDSLEKIKAGWDKAQFIVLNHREQHNLFILGSLEEIFNLLEDNQVTLQTMLGSRFIVGIRERVEEWEKKLATLSETLDEWLTCQRNWMYLENIFGAEDIQKQLPAESQKFLIVDRSWKAIMHRTHEKPLVLNALQPLDNDKTMLSAFLLNNSVLESIQKSLENYLETKRMAFPRFYFLSNDELLEIMSQTRDPHAVQPHIGKCFDAVKRIKFGEGKRGHDILGFQDPGGEYVPFSGDSVKAEGPVEVWLLMFEKSMKKALYDQAKSALMKYPDTDEGAIDRKDWMWSYCAQCVIAIDQVMWTFNGTNALTKMAEGVDDQAMIKFLEFTLKQIDAMVDLVRTPLSKQQRTLLGALLTIDVHARDVVRALVAKFVGQLSDFEWTKQLRYYWDEAADDLCAKQTNSSFQYGYEYLGNGPRLVITPLTDTCYMTLTGALHMRLGGAPAGPAGTGKTETTKDLAKALAVYCVVFNCSDGLDYKIMGRFFSGLAQQGAWACFDEFNRIDIEVLSVIAQQILCIQQAIVKSRKQFDFEGNMIPLNFSFGVFITMNPGYAGRTELPDNLKALFRPVAMMVPDYRLIAEIILFSEGFANALPLSNKMAQLYALSSEQLSKQSHYDFGMRAVKTVLVAAGQLKRKEPENNEDILLIRAMRDSNVPKFLEQDIPLFGGIVQDLFPGITVPFVDYGNLQIAIERAMESLSLQKVPTFITKVIQIHETQLVRHGMMVVGETGSGKSTNVAVLAKALGYLHEDKIVDKDGFYKLVDRLVLNPKSITAGELYGEFNLLTNEWRDGIVPKLVRDCVNASNEGFENRKWIIFDGPVDAIWIENMNTVLDDNKTLCLANSERIKLPSTLHMMFEVQDLKVASPATVSRCGMVYMEQIHVGMLSLVRTWGASVMREPCGLRNSKTLVTIVETHTPTAIEYIRDFCKEKVPTSDNQLIAELLNLMSAKVLSEADPKKLLEDADLVTALYVWSLVWSVGANIIDNARSAFSEWVRKRFGSVINLARHGLLMDDPYGCFVDTTTKDVMPWSLLTPSFAYDSKQPFFDILVPTDDTTRYRYILDTLMNAGHNVLFIAETGVGKSVVISSFLNEMVHSGTSVSYTVGYSAQTKPANLRDVLETKLEKKRKNLLGPPSGKKMFLFIDDLNMPALETYGAQPPNELLRQVIDHGGFYDVHKLFFKNVADTICVSACAPPGGGRNEVSPRLLRHFHLVWLTNLTVNSMYKIFTSILGGFLTHNAPGLAAMAEPLVQGSIEIYTSIQKELLPTPLRSHYTFNLRDLSKVFQGILMVKAKHLDTSDALLKLWSHESSRVFRDRLINEDDKGWFNKAVLKQLHTTLEVPDWTLGNFADLMFGNFVNRDDKDYKELTDKQKISDSLMEYLDEYNITFPSRMELVFFRDAIYHVSRISRVLSQPRGNALLVGVGGSGRQSLTRMASFMADYKCRQIEITRGYGMVEWHENLKEILMLAGTKSTPTVFLFSDTQIVIETFLEDINNILNSGEVPNLYENDEIEKIISAVRPLAKKAGKPETKDAIFQYYVYLVRENLHMVLAMSPIGAGFRTRCRMFPSLVNCCTIDWFNAWPEDALYSVAHRTFDEQKDLGISDHVAALSKMCNKMHRTVELETVKYFDELKRHNYTTPTSYLELIKLYVDILKTQQCKISSNEKRYLIGLSKLNETEEIVAELEVKLTEMQPILEKAAVETAKLLEEVAVDQKDADDQAAIVEADVEAANKVAAEVKAIKDDCQADLDEAMPAYESAVKALSSLDKKSLQEIKAFANPPEMVKFTLEAVCILLDIKPDWGEAKKLISQMDFMDSLKNYDKDNIPVKTIKKVKKYYDDPRFTADGVKAVSSAAMCLCMWVRAMVVYDKVAKSIEPKKAALAEAEGQLANVMSELGKKKADLQVVLDKVATLQATLKATQEKKASLEQQADTAQKQLKRAGQLIGGLGGEKIRWQASAKELGESLVNLVGDMVLAAGCLAYLGPFTAQFRSRIVSQWVSVCKELNIPCGDFSLISALADPVIVRRWQIGGLPADDFSCENGLLTTMGRRWPLMVDPQGQANRWIRNAYAEKNLQIIKLTEKDFLRTLENGIRYGAAVLLENVGEQLDPSLEPVLLKQVFKRGGQMLLRLGDTDVPYSDEFRFMITTKLANPHYMPEICIKVTVINFTVTMKGLEDQLLVDVIKNERPDLEERKDALVVSIASDQSQLREIEEQILTMLAGASGNILDDEELINALARSKTTSTAINQRLSEAEVTTKEINVTREGYRNVATRGSVIYFVVANLALVDPMYQYSLQFYKELFTQRLQKTDKKDVLQDRLDLLIADITNSIYTNVCRGLFEKDKLLYAFMIAANIQLQAKAITDKEWLIFMVGVIVDDEVLDGKAIPSNIKVRNVTEKLWSCAVMLEHQLPEIFGGLCSSISKNDDAWLSALLSEDVHSEPLPGSWDIKMSKFHRLILTRCLREEKTTFAVKRYVSDTIGEYFTESPPFDLEGAYADSTPVSPLIFILSPGADPTDYLLQLAESKGKGTGGMRIISLGQGQGPIAEVALNQSQLSGDWICLQNCHLAVSWLPKLEMIVEKMQNDPDRINGEFRLWLTSMPSATFPVTVLQNGIKVTNEPPRGLRANLLRTFLDINSEEYESCSKSNVFKKLIFAAAFFNALVLERRKFGAVGWNIPYEWMNSDLKAAMTQVRMYVEEQVFVPWETLNVSVSNGLSTNSPYSLGINLF